MTQEMQKVGLTNIKGRNMILRNNFPSSFVNILLTMDKEKSSPPLKDKFDILKNA